VRALRINVVVGGRFHAGQLFTALTELGHDVHIYTSSPARYFSDVPSTRITFFPKPSQLLQKLFRRRMPRWTAELSAIAFDAVISRSMRPADLVWGFNGDSLYTGRKIKRTGGTYIVDRACPHFLTQEAQLVEEAQRTQYPYARFSNRIRQRFIDEYALADAIVVPSAYSARSFSDHGVDHAKIHVAPLDANAPPLLPHDRSVPEFRGAQAGRLRVGIVGGSFLRKGILHLLRAMAAIDDPDTRLLLRADRNIVAGHREADQLAKQIDALFIPYLPDINQFYSAIDIFVLPSIDEGFGMVAFEALRAGVPLIASTNVGAIDGMTPERDFLLVPAGDAQALKDAILRLRDDAALRTRIGNAGRDFYVRRQAAGSQYQWKVAELIQQFSNDRK